jgi:transposase InsO family protein
MKKVSTYLKHRVLGAIDGMPGKTIRERIKAVSELVFEDEDGTPHKFTWRTIETWRCRYLKHGVASVQPKPRSDLGKSRKTSPEEVAEAIEKVLPRLRGKTYSIALIYRLCIEDGVLQRQRIAPNTFRRIVNRFKLLEPHTRSDNKKRRAFSKQFANQCWQADTLHGPFVKDASGTPRPSYLVAFIDDASRLLTHGQFFHEENVESLITAIRQAFYKRGIPEQLYVDNGSIYTSKEITLICARTGCLLCHTPVRDGAAKGKIERFFRTVRAQFLSLQLDLRSIKVLNDQFTRWVEDEYNNRLHSTLQMKPIDRFGLDLSRIIFLPPNQDNDELFHMEVERQVKKDNTFSLQNVRFEAPCDLRRQRIQVRYDRQRKRPDKASVYFKGERLGLARPLDPVANDRPPKALKDTHQQQY